MIFLRPHVVRDANQDGRRLTLDRYDYMRRAQDNARPPRQLAAARHARRPILPPLGTAAQPVSYAARAVDLRPEQRPRSKRGAPGPAAERTARARMRSQRPAGAAPDRRPGRAVRHAREQRSPPPPAGPRRGRRRRAGRGAANAQCRIAALARVHRAARGEPGLRPPIAPRGAGALDRPARSARGRPAAGVLRELGYRPETWWRHEYRGTATLPYALGARSAPVLQGDPAGTAGSPDLQPAHAGLGGRAEARRHHRAWPRSRRFQTTNWKRCWPPRYAQAGDAASVVAASENEIDLDRLMQDIPEIEDLLDAQDDAPVIRMINALFTQAARDGASDIHIEAFETHSGGALPRRRYAARRSSAARARCTPP